MADETMLYARDVCRQLADAVGRDVIVSGPFGRSRRDRITAVDVTAGTVQRQRVTPRYGVCPRESESLSPGQVVTGYAGFSIRIVEPGEQAVTRSR